MKQGTQTSEFYLTIGVIIVGGVLISLGVISEDTFKWMIGGGGVYSLSRGFAKNGNGGLK